MIMKKLVFVCSAGLQVYAIQNPFQEEFSIQTARLQGLNST